MKVLMTKKPDASLGVPTCEVLVHGSGECEQLGLGDGVLERKKPTLVKSLLDKNIIAVASGSLHNLALSAEGTVYSWGCNDDGALGRSGEENVPLPIDMLVRIKKIAVGDCHSAFLDISGRLWLCGTYKDSSGHLGFPDFSKGIGHVHHKQLKPVLVSGFPARTKVEDVVCGANHTVVMLASTDKRRSGSSTSSLVRVMSFGNDEFGQLGLGNRMDEEGRREEDTVMLKHTSRGQRLGKIKLFPRDVVMDSRNIICKIFATAQGSFIKTVDGSIYGCGLNNFGQIGFGSTSVHPVRLFTKVEPLSSENEADQIRIITGGTVHCAALLNKGQVITWGRRDYSGAPSDSSNDIQAPRQLDSLKNISHIACGGSHTLAVSEDGHVYAWGFGGTHQLGNLPRDISMGAAGPDEEPQDEQEPYLIQSKQLGERFVIAVAAGAQHSLELAFSGQYAQEIAPTPPASAAKRRRTKE